MPINLHGVACGWLVPGAHGWTSPDAPLPDDGLSEIQQRDEREILPKVLWRIWERQNIHIFKDEVSSTHTTLSIVSDDLYTWKKRSPLLSLEREGRVKWWSLPRRMVTSLQAQNPQRLGRSQP